VKRRGLLGLAAVVLLAAAPVRAGEPMKDLARLRQESNAGRLAALQEILKEHGLPFEAQPFTPKAAPETAASKPEEGINVVVSFGSGPREIVVGAHYDAVKLKDGTLSPGMGDNGASVIVLVRLAKALKGRALTHRVRVVFFDQEEIGLLGSKAYVAAQKPGEIAAAINLDIAGYGGSLAFRAGPEERNAPLYRVVRQVCAERALACTGFPRFPPSDDRSFEAAGVPNVSLAFVPEVQAHQLWLMLNGGAESGIREGFVPEILKTIHTPGDTLDKIDAAALELAPEVVLDVLLKLDASLK